MVSKSVLPNSSIEGVFLCFSLVIMVLGVPASVRAGIPIVLKERDDYKEGRRR